MKKRLTWLRLPHPRHQKLRQRMQTLLPEMHLQRRQQIPQRKQYRLRSQRWNTPKSPILSLRN